MQITIVSTDKVARINGAICRFWDGVTESGARCVVFVHLIAVHEDDDNEEFGNLLASPTPAELEIVGVHWE